VAAGQAQNQTPVAAAPAQNQTAEEWWPELDVYWKFSQNMRLEFTGSSTRDRDESYFDRQTGVYLGK
jgi:hypothetical protein